MELLVSLGDTPVGIISTHNDGRNEFSFSAEYLHAEYRPVLGQYFEDHLTVIHRSHTRLPPYFSNLLPEGGLRELVARRANVHTDREAELIAVLGEDLPGAVVVQRISDRDVDIEPSSSIEVDSSTDGALRFSLAGAQLKFSVLYGAKGRGPTLPIDGKGGTWIAKLPSETYPRVPENEFAMINWAARIGINVPEVRLVRIADIEGLPVTLASDQMVFLSRRFDRPDVGNRIHQEDFAQILNVRQSQRYGVLGYAGIARIVREVAGDADFDEVVRRIVFNVLIGNGDAHLKNWSLVYPDGVAARLSPAYDLVSTIIYIPEDKLALRLARENRFDKIRMTHFQKLAEKAGVPSDRVVRLVRDTVTGAMDTLPPSTEMEAAHQKTLRSHLHRLPLVADASLAS